MPMVILLISISNYFHFWWWPILPIWYYCSSVHLTISIFGGGLYCLWRGNAVPDCAALEETIQRHRETIQGRVEHEICGSISKSFRFVHTGSFCVFSHWSKFFVIKNAYPNCPQLGKEHAFQILILISRFLLYCPLFSLFSSGAASPSPGLIRKSLLNIPEEW